MSIATKFDIEPDRECCYHCSFVGWHIGVGQGIRCMHPKNEYRIFEIEHNLKLPLIPGLRQKCERFEWKTKCESKKT